MSEQLAGPIAVHAIDATGHVVGGVQFEPRVTARRPVTAEAAAGAAAAAAATAGAAAAAAAAAVQCAVERTEWQRSPSGACEPKPYP